MRRRCYQDTRQRAPPPAQVPEQMDVLSRHSRAPISYEDAEVLAPVISSSNRRSPVSVTDRLSWPQQDKFQALPVIMIRARLAAALNPL